MESRQQRQLEISRSTLRESKNRRQKMKRESCAGQGRGGWETEKGNICPSAVSLDSAANESSDHRASLSAVAAAGYWLLRAMPRLVYREPSMGTLPVAGSFLCRLLNFDCSLSPSRKDEKRSDRIIFYFNICCKIMPIYGNTI